MYSKKLSEAETGYTYDDFLLVPGPSEVEPKDIVTKSKVSKNYEVNNPIISAPMDTVTESQMAIALAQVGCLGIIHRNMTINQQVEEVKKVKMAGELAISDVITISPDSSISESHALMEAEHISGLPVVENEKIVGIISRRDIQPILRADAERKVSEIMTSDVVTVPESITPAEALDIAYENKIERLPVVRDDKIVGILTIKDILEYKNYPNASLGKDGKFLAAAATGPFDLDRAMALDAAGAEIIAIDSAHGHNMNIVRNIEVIKDNIDADLLVGNIATAEAAEDLISHGADGLKVGIGPGSICTTRVIAGIGVPQLTAVANVASVAEDSGIPVIADGGLRYSGDIAKAIAVGADAVMMGNLLAGTHESPGDIVVMNGRKYKQYRGMGSLGAMTGGVGAGTDRYFQNKSNMNHTKLVPEGVEGATPYKGKVSETIFQMIGGLKSSMGYCGAGTILEMQKKAKLVKITSSGIKESHPHDLLITNESPNYPSG